MNRKERKKWMLWMLVFALFVGFLPIYPVRAEGIEVDPKATAARVYETGTEKAISPQKGSLVDVYVTITDKNISKKELDALTNPIVAKKREDSFEAQSSKYGELYNGIKSTGDGVVFQVKFTNLEYSGSSNKLIFDFSYGMDGAKKKELKVAVPNCVEYNYSDYSGTVPKIEVSNIKFPATIKGGDTFTLQFDASSNIKDIVFKNVELDYGTVSEGLETTSILDSMELPNFKADEANTTELVLKAKKELNNDFETITLNYTYSYRQNGEFKNDQKNSVKIKIPVVKNKKEEKKKEEKPDDMRAVPYIVIDRYDYGEEVTAGESVTVKSTLKNMSKFFDVQNIAILVSSSDNLVSKEASNKILIDKLKKGQEKEVELQFLTEKSTATGFQTVTFEISYDYQNDKKRESKTTTEVMKIPVKAIKKAKKKKKKEKEEIAKRTPSVMISHYEYGGKVPAGKKFTLDMVLQNTSKELNIENLTMSLEVAEGLAITSSSNTFFFDNLSAQGQAEQKIEMQALPSAKSASTNVTVNFKYEYVDKKQRNSVTSSETIAIPIYQPDRMKFTMGELPEVIYVGEENTLSVQYINKGKSSLYNLSAELKGDLTATEKVQNIGNVDSGNSGSIDFYVTANKAKKLKGTIVITYEDDNLEVKKVKLPYELEAQEMEVDPNMGGELDMDLDQDMMDQENGMSKNIKMKVGIGIGAFCLLVVIIVMIRTIRKKKQRQMLEELEQFEEE